MIEILPIRSLTDEDSRVFGVLSVNLGKLLRNGLPVGNGIVVTAPEFKLRSLLEHFDFGSKEVFHQSLTLVTREINKIPVPEILKLETKRQKKFLLNGKEIKKVEHLWLELLAAWMEQIKERLWEKGFYPGITEGLEPQIVVFFEEVKSAGRAYFDPLQDDVEIQVRKGSVHPSDLKKIVEIVQTSNKRLFIPHEYEWILDRELKFVGIKPYTPPVIAASQVTPTKGEGNNWDNKKIKSAVKVFFELSERLSASDDVDGVYIDSGKIFDLNKPKDSFEDLTLKLVETAEVFPNSPVFFKLADKSEGMGKIRGALRLLHQKSLFEPLMECLKFARHKKGFTNINIVIPFLRGVNELLHIKRELAVNKLMRKNSLELWAELAVPENIVNLENYLIAGIDGVVLNLDELISYINGFDNKEGELIFYKNEVEGLIKFLEDALRLLHKSKLPFIAYGSLALYPKVLEYLVEKGVSGVVVERYETHGIRDLLHQVEKRMILKRS